MSNIVLTPINPALYQQPNNEPQYITSKDPNKAILYLDSQDCKLELNKTNILMSTVKRYGDIPSTLALGITRLSIDSFSINWITPNINVRNNTITFFSSNSGLFHTVTIPEGFYDTSTLIITAVVNALNTATGSSGLTFSFTTVTYSPDIYNLNSAGGNYYISLTCTAITKGYQLYNLPISQTPQNSKLVGAINGWYTKYIDICSNTLSQYVKIRTNSTGYSSNIIFRVLLNTNNKPTLTRGVNIHQSTQSYNYLPNSPLISIDFTLRDQFGEELYIPQGAEGTASGFFWDVSFAIEL